MITEEAAQPPNPEPRFEMQAVSFAPTYSMYPEYARDTSTRWVQGRRAEDFSLDLDAARALVLAEQ